MNDSYLIWTDLNWIARNLKPAGVVPFQVEPSYAADVNPSWNVLTRVLYIFIDTLCLLIRFYGQNIRTRPTFRLFFRHDFGSNKPFRSFLVYCALWWLNIVSDNNQCNCFVYEDCSTTQLLEIKKTWKWRDRSLNAHLILGKCIFSIRKNDLVVVGFEPRPLRWLAVTLTIRLGWAQKSVSVTYTESSNVGRVLCSWGLLAMLPCIT